MIITYNYFTDSDIGAYCDSEQWKEYLVHKGWTMSQFNLTIQTDSEYVVKQISDTKHKVMIVTNAENSEFYKCHARHTKVI